MGIGTSLLSEVEAYQNLVRQARTTGIQSGVTTTAEEVGPKKAPEHRQRRTGTMNARALGTRLPAPMIAGKKIAKIGDKGGPRKRTNGLSSLMTFFRCLAQARVLKVLPKALNRGPTQTSQQAAPTKVPLRMKPWLGCWRQRWKQEAMTAALQSQYCHRHSRRQE